MNDSFKADPIDRAILNAIQEDFPLAKRPFAAIGQRVGVSEKEALERVKRLTGEGYIRRIGLVLEHKKLGYKSLLCGARVNTGILASVAEQINREPGVTHNYEREGELNLWFTVTMKTMADIGKFITDLEKTYGIRIYRFPEKRTFKIKTFFPV